MRKSKRMNQTLQMAITNNHKIIIEQEGRHMKKHNDLSMNILER